MALAKKKAKKVSGHVNRPKHRLCAKCGKKGHYAKSHKTAKGRERIK